MKVMDYNPGMRIVVTAESEDDGSGNAKYLEVRDTGEKLIAVRFHRRMPKRIPQNHVLIRWN